MFKMREYKASPNSQIPKYLPSCLEEQELSDWEDSSQLELSSLGEGVSYKEPSDWEASLGLELSEDKHSLGQEFSKGNGNRPSFQSSWEDDNDNELPRDSWVHVNVRSFGVKPFQREEEEWDKLSLLDLSVEEDREQRVRCFAEDRLPLPAPWKAWVEVPQAGTEKAVPARHRHPSPSATPLQAKAPHKKRPSRARLGLWVLCSLFCCPCLMPLPDPDD